MRQSKKDAVRLNKLISEAGFCSRREADTYIEQERVTVNSHVAKPGDRVYRTDFIKIDGEPLRFLEKPVYTKKKPEFASKRITRNLDKPQASKPKVAKDSPKDEKKSATEKPLKSEKVDKPKGIKPTKNDDKPKVGEAKRWFSGRKR